MKTLHVRRYGLFALAFLFIAGPVPSIIAQQDSADDAPLTRREFEKFLEEYRQFRGEYIQIKQENEKLRKELAELKTGTGEISTEDLQARLDTFAWQQRESILEDVREEIRDVTEPLLPGMTNITLGGSGVASYRDQGNSDSTFGAGVAPLLLWKPTDRLLLEAEFGFGLGSEDTSIEFGLAQISYVVNDYVTVGAGVFRNPFLTFWPRWHPSWINKAANMPLLYDRGFVGPSALGVQVRGGAAIGKQSKVNYSLYFVNGPKFRTSQIAAGRLNANNNRDNNNNKGVGGRFGYLPVPELELGYSFFTGKVGDSGSAFSRVDAFMHGVDLTYGRQFDAIRGWLDLRAEAVWIDTDNVAFTGPFNPFTFDNKRNGWFVQMAYRPTLVDLVLGPDIEMKNFEFIARYGQSREPGSNPLGSDRSRLTLGVDYWIRPSVVLKTAYARDNVQGGKNQDGVFMQFGVGF